KMESGSAERTAAVNGLAFRPFLKRQALLRVIGELRVSGQGGRWCREVRRLVGNGANMKLAVNLLVLRCKDIEVTRRFYEQLGLAFVEEKHGKGPQHYAWESRGFVLELYPTAEGQAPDNVRIGFSTPLLADLAGNLRHSSNVNVVKQPYATADRLMMLL